MEIKEIVTYLENLIPPAIQEDYDNSGLILGNPDSTINKILICLDVTEEIIEEAIKHHCDLVISHHPLIFKAIKKLTGRTYIERTLISAIRNNISLYAVHTNLDLISNGINKDLCNKFDITNTKVLKPRKGLLKKLVTFCPDIKLSDGSYVPEIVRSALFEAGAGHIGNYDSCSYNVSGSGTFRGLEGTNQFIGTQGDITFQNEIKIEVIFPSYRQQKIIEKLLKVHPYQEVAYDIYSLDNEFNMVGEGMIGELKYEMDEREFLDYVKLQLNLKHIRHTALLGNKVQKVAVCSGSGSFLINEALSQGANIYISSDIKYHEFFLAENKMIIADVGHYESEQCAQDILFDLITKKFPNFAVQKTSIKTNPIYYL